MRRIVTIIWAMTLCQQMLAQEQRLTAEQVLAEMDSPTFVPTVKVGKVLYEGDSIQYMEMNNVYVYPQLTFKNKRQAESYMRLVKNVKKVLPIAKEARQMLIETTEYLETLPNEKAKEEHIKRVEDDIFRTYKPKMKKLTYSQGKLLIKLIHGTHPCRVLAGVCLGLWGLAKEGVRRPGCRSPHRACRPDGRIRPNLKNPYYFSNTNFTNFTNSGDLCDSCSFILRRTALVLGFVRRPEGYFGRYVSYRHSRYAR